ncbi:MAG TPA: threonine synthase [Elusimicrobiota bacterium]|nr:threonine synthase [Elusimicrobiota bacterium]
MGFLGYRCLSCGKEQGGGKSLYGCPACGSNLDVVYDHAALRKKVTPKKLEGRPWTHWRYRELLPLKREIDFPLPVGGGPLLPSARLAHRAGLKNLFLKDDTRNPSASFKDRAGSVVLAKAIEEKASLVACASTGNAGSSLACLGAALGQKTLVFVPRTAPKPKIAQLQIFGARVLAVDGTYDDAYDLCGKACREFGWYNRSTGINPFTREGKKTVSYEIWEQLGRRSPDLVFVPVGDGNILSGVWKGFRDLLALGWIRRMPKLMAVQSTLSNSVSRTVASRRGTGAGTPVRLIPVQATTLADSISVNLPRDGAAAVLAVEETGGSAVEVTDLEILAAQKLLAETVGLFVEPAGATGVAGLLKFMQGRTLPVQDRVVCLLTGNGLKDVGAVLKYVGEPPVIEPRLESLKKTVSDLL